MKIANYSPPPDRAFTLIEILVSVSIVGIMFVTLYVGIATGFSVVESTRQNLRATQILQDKMETIRLYNWDQVTSNGFIPATFTAPYFPVGTNDGGLTYHGTLVVTNPQGSLSYSNEIREVILTVEWTSGEVTRNRTLKTFIARNGLQNYLY